MIRRSLLPFGLIVLFGVVAIRFLLPQWLEKDIRPIERVAATDHLAPPRYRVIRTGEPDIEVTVNWEYGKQNAGKEEFFLEKVSAGISNGSAVNGPDVGWDATDGFGGYPPGLSTHTHPVANRSTATTPPEWPPTHQPWRRRTGCISSGLSAVQGFVCPEFSRHSQVTTLYNTSQPPIY